jgi:hypothetical protein
VGRSDRGWEIAVEPIILTDIGRVLFSKNVLVSSIFDTPNMGHLLTGLG